MIATTSPAAAEWRATDRAEPPAPETRRARPRIRRPSTPFLLRLGMALALVPVVFFAVAVQVGVARNDSTVRTVGRDATRGITVALTPSGFPEDYNAKRGELHQNLVLAASESQSGAAYQQPLANIDYVLAHYHTLVKDAFAAGASGNTARAAELYARAHVVMADTLLPAADFVDKANTYVLNNTYDSQKARSASTGRVIVVAWIVLLAFLVIAQLLLARKFRRVVNLALALATLVAVAAGSFALSRLDASTGHLASAREQAFDSVHVLARARATVVSARQAEGQLLLDPAHAADARTGFLTQTERLFRVQGRDDVAAVAQSGTVPEGAGGYLATVAAAEGTGEHDEGEHDEGGRDESGHDAVMAFGDFLAEDTNLRNLVDSDAARTAQGVYDNARTFAVLSDAIDDAQAVDQATFDAHAGLAADATDNVGEITTVAAGAVLLLMLLGLYQRLREYSA